MQNSIYGSFVTIQYHTKCTNPLYSKFTSKKNERLYVLLQPLPGHCLCSDSGHRQVFTSSCQYIITPNNVTISSTKNHRYGISQQIYQQNGSITLTTVSKLGDIFLTESQK